MLVKIKSLPYGYKSFPVSVKTREMITDYLNQEMNVKSIGDVFYQSLDNLYISFDYHLKSKHKRDIEKGYDVIIRIDSWEYAHHFGYNTQTLFEGGKLCLSKKI